MFTLFNLETAEIVSRAVFADGRAASRAARLLSTKTGRRYQPRRAPATDIDWQAREQARFASGDYQPLCDRLASLAPENHYAHIAKKRPELIAYTKDAEKGAADKQSLISIRAYVDIVAPDYFSDQSKDALANEQLSYARGIASPLRFAGPGTDEATADEIERVYTNYDRSIHALDVSCMRKPANHYDGRVDGKATHPVRAYAGGDLAIAYIQNDDGLTIARALCWPEKKLYSRVYAEGDAIHVLLRALGYQKSRYYSSGADSLAGARLARIETDCGSFLGPYLDEIQAVSDCGDCLEISRDGELVATNINGIIPVKPRIYCERCEDDADEEDARTVYTRGNMTRSQTWCSHCCDHYAQYCAGSHEYFDGDSVNMVCIDDEIYTQQYVDENAGYCDRYEEYTFQETQTVVIDEDGSEENWSESAIDNHAYKWGGVYYSEDVEHETVIYRREWYVIAWRAIAFVRNKAKKIPTYQNADGSLFYEATDGRFYLRDCENRTTVNLPCEIQNA